MTVSTVSHHISKQFDNELEDIREQVLAMGGLVEQQLVSALKALTESEADFARNVMRKAGAMAGQFL